RSPNASAAANRPAVAGGPALRAVKVPARAARRAPLAVRRPRRALRRRARLLRPRPQRRPLLHRMKNPGRVPEGAESKKPRIKHGFEIDRLLSVFHAWPIHLRKQSNDVRAAPYARTRSALEAADLISQSAMTTPARWRYSTPPSGWPPSKYWRSSSLVLRS